MGSSWSDTGVASRVLCPLSVAVDDVAAMLNFELADHPVYDSCEVQWFDDDHHGTGMLAFLSRREGRRVDYYTQPGLRLDRGNYRIGGGTGSWTETDFDVARLAVHADGIDAEIRFTDVDGRSIEIRVDDRDGRPRHRAGLLAPVSAGIERPTSLMLVWMPGFDLVRVAGAPPVIRIGTHDAATGRLPGARVHRRHLIKYAAPLVAVRMNPADDGSHRVPIVGQQVEQDGTGGVTKITAEQAGHRARILLDPAFPHLADLPDGSSSAGRWGIEVDGVRLTGGAWSAVRRGVRGQPRAGRGRAMEARPPAVADACGHHRGAGLPPLAHDVPLACRGSARPGHVDDGALGAHRDRHDSQLPPRDRDLIEGFPIT